MTSRRLAAWTTAGFAVFYLLANPIGAADVVSGAWGVLADAAESLARFVDALT